MLLLLRFNVKFELLLINEQERSSIGDNVVDEQGVFDVDDDGDERVDVDEHSPSLLLVKCDDTCRNGSTDKSAVTDALMSVVDADLTGFVAHVNTSSSDESSERLVGATTVGGRGANCPAARRFCSSSSSWPIKLRLGEMIGRANLTSL